MTPSIELVGPKADCKKNTNNLKLMEAIGRAGKPFVFFGALSLALYYKKYYRCHNDIDTMILKQDKDWWIEYIRNLDFDFRVKINIFEFEKKVFFGIPTKPVLQERIQENRAEALNKQDHINIDIVLHHDLEDTEYLHIETLKINDQDIKIMNPEFLKLTKIRRMQFWHKDIQDSKELLQNAIESNQVNEEEILQIRKIIKEQEALRKPIDKKDISDIKNYFNIDIDIDNIQNM